MLDPRRVRQEPGVLIEALAARGRPEENEASIRRVVRLDEERRGLIAEGEGLKASRNRASQEIGDRKRRGENADEAIAEMQGVAERIRAIDPRLRQIEEEIEGILLAIPNPTHGEVPAGGEENNRVVREWGTPRSFSFEPRPHWELGAELGILDLPAGARVTGSGFPAFRRAGAKLQRALVAWMLDLHSGEHGYEEVSPPFLVNRAALTGTGQLPKFEEDVYAVPSDDLFLVPTAEVPLTNFHREQILEPEALPIAYTAYTPCFRREAGAAGKDTRGLLRLHQFDKVELVRFERQERSFEALEELVGHAERVLQLLELPFRTVLLSAGDTGFASSMTYDLEVWAPGVGKWLEVSSCSNMTDFQARRAGIRYRPETGARPEYAHTLNGSGVALPRTVIALLENGQQEDGSVVIPEALRSYLGTDRLTRP
jgi:seryl-tRNA synthetase